MWKYACELFIHILFILFPCILSFHIESNNFFTLIFGLSVVMNNACSISCKFLPYQKHIMCFIYRIQLKTLFQSWMATLLCYRCRYVTHVYTWIFFLKNLGKYYRLLFLYIINCSFLVIIFRIHKLLTRLKHYLVMFSFGIVYRIGLPFEVSLMIHQNTAAI